MGSGARRVLARLRSRDPAKTSRRRSARQQVTQQRIDENCPDCGRPLAIRLGRSGNFISCTGFPECRYARNLPRDGEEETGPGAEGSSGASELEGRKCPKCGSALVVKTSRNRKIRGMQPISGVPARGAARKAARDGHHVSGVPRRELARATFAPRQALLFMLHLSRNVTTRHGTSRWTSPVPGAAGRSSL